MKLTFGNMKMELNVFNVGKHMFDDVNSREVQMIDAIEEQQVTDPCIDHLEEINLEENQDVEEVYELGHWLPKFELPPIEKKIVFHMLFIHLSQN